MTRSLIIMGLLTTILNLFGCSGQTKKNDHGLSKEMEEQLTNSIEAFKNRQIYTELTEQIIDTTSDENLLQVIFDNLSQKQPGDYEKEYETVMSWNKSRQAIYMIWVLEAEVNNGGYNQFYFNSSGHFYQHLPEAGWENSKSKITWCGRAGYIIGLAIWRLKCFYKVFVQGSTAGILKPIVSQFAIST